VIIEMAASALISIGTARTGGFGEAARYVEQQAIEGRRRFQESHYLGIGTVFDELCRTFDDCRTPNWDGYGAEPVLDETYRWAYRFLEALPLGTRPPSVGVEPDGHLTFEWYRTPSRLLSVSVSPDGMIYYAALLGSSKRSGTEPFSGDVPAEILQIIHKLFPV
jgi:hypothetical protein